MVSQIIVSSRLAENSRLAEDGGPCNVNIACCEIGCIGSDGSGPASGCEWASPRSEAKRSSSDLYATASVSSALQLPLTVSCVASRNPANRDGRTAVFYQPPTHHQAIIPCEAAKPAFRLSRPHNARLAGARAEPGPFACHCATVTVGVSGSELH